MICGMEDQGKVFATYPQDFRKASLAIPHVTGALLCKYTESGYD